MPFRVGLVVAEWLVLRTGEIQGTDVGPETDIITEVFRDFSQSFQVND